MKMILGLIAAALLQQHGGGISWSKDVQESLDRARSSGKPAMLFFTAEWCGFCKKMSENALSDKQVVKNSEEFVRIYVDCTNRDDHAGLKEKYGVTGYPTLVFLDGQGRQANAVVGAQGAETVLLAMKSATQPDPFTRPDPKVEKEPKSGPARTARSSRRGQEEGLKPLPEGYTEISFDRVHLRNGNSIDGSVVARTQYGVQLRIEGGDIIIKHETITDIERVTMRYVTPPQPKPETPVVEEKPDETSITRTKVTTPTTRKDPLAKPAPNVKLTLPASFNSTVGIKPETATQIREILERTCAAAPENRYNVLRGVEVLGSGTAPYLADIMDQVDPVLADMISSVIGVMGDEKAGSVLRKKLDSPVAEIRRVAARAIGTLADKGSASKLRSLALKDPDLPVRTTCIEALGGIGDVKSISMLAKMITEENVGLRQSASNALQNIARSGSEATDEAVGALSNHLRSGKTESVVEVLTLLGNLGAKRAVPEIIPKLEDNEKSIRAAAAQALGKINDPQSAESLISRCRVEQDQWVTIQIFNALQNLRDRRAVKAIIDRMDSGRDNLDIRSRGGQALRVLTGQNFATDVDKWIEWYRSVTGKEEE